jgi:hypothetical protein
MKYFLPVPKILSWTSKLPQQYISKQKILLTSGCSFTSSTLQLEGPASWPGFVKDRCGFDHCVDYSYPGVGNQYIGDSIQYHIEKIHNDQLQDLFVMVMWSGLDRKDTETQADQQPKLGTVSYKTTQSAFDQVAKSAEKIQEIYQYLSNKKIPFVFTFYANVLFPPYFPKRDTTPNFEDYLDKPALTAIQALPWVPSVSEQFLFEYALISGDLDRGDHFHPTYEGNLSWTDSVLLPAICNKGQIQKIDQ